MPPLITRHGGADRFEVSAAISAATFGTSVPVAFVASGADFPDALAGAAAAGRLGGPLLLVTRDEVPASVKTELGRLEPKRIVVLGGTASISTAVELSMASYSGRVERIAGPDRYHVAAAVASSVFHGEDSIVYVASGEGFADALSASSAAGDADSPVLLVPRNEVPDAVRSVLAAERDLRTIIVIGGPATISDSVIATLRGYAPTTRIGGADRYAVSAATSAAQFCPDQWSVYVASGETYPDALSGSAAAIAVGSPVILVSRDVIPAAVTAELHRLSPQRFEVLGGPNTVSESVLRDLRAYLRPCLSCGVARDVGGE